MPRHLAALALATATALPAAAQDLPLPLTVRGNEPFWSLAITPETILFEDMEGARLEAPYAPPTLQDGAQVFDTPAGPLRLTATLCHDDMSGMPYPLSATLTRDGRDLAACAGDPAALLAGDWIANVLDGTQLPATAFVILSFSDGALTGRSACNRYRGTYTLSGEGLALGGFALTRMACTPDLMAIEQAVLAAFATVTQFDIAADGALLLKSDGSTTVLTATR